MKHSVCGGWIEIRTDPKNTAYVVTEGGRRRDTGLDADYNESGVSEIRLRLCPAEGAVDRQETDAFAKLEGKIEDKRRFLTEKGRMEELLKRQERDWEDPYERSQKLRRAFRAERKSREIKDGATEALKDKMSLGIELLDETEADRLRAGMVDFAPSISGSSRARTRPFFNFTSASRKPPALRFNNGKEKKEQAHKPVDSHAKRKALLHQELSENTRAAVDPFVSDDMVWLRGFRRRKVEKLIGETGTADNNEDSDCDDGNGNSNQVEDHNTSTAGEDEATAALVDYGSSDSD
jgi:coiled-coil domain-containing protein 130